MSQTSPPVHPFELGRSYDREDVLRFVGSRQPVSGIVYSEVNSQFVAIFSGGRGSRPAGYTDGWNPDGVFTYCGQGAKGNQKLAGPNAVLARHEGSVLLFETWKPRHSWKGQQRFLGNFRVLGHDTIIAKGQRAGDLLLVFSLMPEDRVPGDVPIRPSGGVPAPSLDTLRSRAIVAGRITAPVRMTKTEYRERGLAVALYALARAAGVCEACGAAAPFVRQDGTPFLEVHHTRRLADDGPDDIHHVGAICPNCHREAHYGPDIEGFRVRLETRILETEDHADGHK